MNKKKKEIKPNQKFIKKDNKKIEVQKNKENNNSKEKNIKELIKRNKIAKAIYVGDTKKDCESANMNGLHFIWAEYGFGKCDKYYKKIEDISELINMEI